MRALAVALLLAAPAAAQPTAAADEQAAVRLAAARGALIHAYDQAAWHGTDDMLAKVRAPQTKVAGYLADGPPDAPRLIFFDRQPVPQAFYVAQFRGTQLVSGRVLEQGDDRALPADAVRRLKALAVASTAIRQAGVRPCGTAPFNTVVLPVEPGTGIVRVYFLTPQTDRNHLPFGGHYAVDVAADGSAGVPRAFSRSCLALPTTPPQGAAMTVGMTVSHLLDPVPTEIHVFSSLSTGKPVYVATMNPSPRLWVVNGARIGDPRPIAPAKK